MNYYGAKDLSSSFLTVRNNTITIAEDIPEKDYQFRAANDVRSVAQTLVHIAIAPNFQEEIHGKDRLTTLENFDFPSRMTKIQAEEQKPRTKAEIIALLRQNGDRFGNWLATLSDDFLGERVFMRPGMTPEYKTRFEMIIGVKEHEMHHRGQLMLVERMLGIVPHLTRTMQERIAAMQKSAAGATRA